MKISSGCMDYKLSRKMDKSIGGNTWYHHSPRFNSPRFKPWAMEMILYTLNHFNGLMQSCDQSPIELQNDERSPDVSG